MSLKFKKYIDAIRPYVPGKPIEDVQRELGLSEVIKLASNENSLGLSAKAKEAIINELDSFYLYPDGYAWKLRKKLAAHIGVSPDEIIFGNGSNELIEFIAKGFIESGDTVVSSQYAFLCYPLLTQVSDGRYVQVPARGYAYDLDAIADAIDEKTRVVFLANPNNPTGTYFTKEEFDRFLKRVPEHVVIALDEAYVDFIDASDYPNGLSYFRDHNVIVLRTFSKAYGLAGFRIGFGIARDEIITYLNKIRQPFNVNALAQCAACAVLDDSAYMQSSQKLAREGKAYFYKELRRLGLEYVESATNFVLIDLKRDSKQFFEECLKKGVIVRDMKAYRLDTCVRVTIGLPEENKKTIEVMEAILKK
jgi:histidinol-phosphate aminotransferase